MVNLTSKIKKIAIDQGFDKVGITSAIQPEKSHLLGNWLKKNYHGTMYWMSRHKDHAGGCGFESRPFRQ